VHPQVRAGLEYRLADLLPSPLFELVRQSSKSVAARLHAAERALADPDPAVRDRAVREAAKIVQAAYRECVPQAGVRAGAAAKSSGRTARTLAEDR